VFSNFNSSGTDRCTKHFAGCFTSFCQTAHCFADIAAGSSVLDPGSFADSQHLKRFASSNRFVTANFTITAAWSVGSRIAAGQVVN
jgi:hypothetical protein